MKRDIVKYRQELLLEMENNTFDVLIIGGGITGAGIALDAQQRGMTTALIEMQDFAAGTSSRSTKLVHGGLRYLKQFEIRMVAEVGRERAIVYENGPHVTTPEWMLLPMYKGGSLGKLTTSIGLTLYDFLARVKGEERHQVLSSEEALHKEPLLRSDGLKGGGYYVEYRTDDARLTIEVLKKAVELGSKAVNYVKAEELLYEEGNVVGVIARDVIGGDTYKIKAKEVVNATGPWVDSLRRMDGPITGKMLRLTKGVHIVFDQSRLPLRQSLYFDTSDGRMVFAIPREDKVYVGTTDTDYDGDIVNPRMSEKDRDYLLDVVNRLFPKMSLTAKDVESSWAGLRPLIYEMGKSPSEVSRRDEIFVSNSGLITIAGGKLTGYRKMAETITDILANRLMKQGRGPFDSCSTKTLPISGGEVGGSLKFAQYVHTMTEEGVRAGLSSETAAKLVRRYGSNVSKVYEWLSCTNNSYDLPEDFQAEILYMIEAEMVVKPVDLIIRRTGALLFQIDRVRHYKDAVIQLMADYLMYSEKQKHEYTKELEHELNAVSSAD